MSEPDYYTMGGLSPLKAFEEGLLTREEYKGFLKGNIIKYTIRAGEKDDALLDIVKAMDYLYHLHACLKEEEEKRRSMSKIDLIKEVELEDNLEDVKKMIKNFKKEYL